MKEYKIISENLYQILELKVNDAIKEGYMPTGGVIIDNYNEFKPRYLQAVYKISNEEN